MPTATAEDYLKQLFNLQQRRPDVKLVPIGQLASAVGVVPGTATTMVKSLAACGWVEYQPRAGARLTRTGQRLALSVLRRHRLVELLLVKVLGLDWSEVHAEAEQLEHAISDKVLARIDEYLGHPTVDPHGDPIPTASGQLLDTHPASLADCPTGRPVQIVRIADQDAEFLQFLRRQGLVPGATVTVEQRSATAQAVQVRIPTHEPVSLGLPAAQRILVQEQGA